MVPIYSPRNDLRRPGTEVAPRTHSPSCPNHSSHNSENASICLQFPYSSENPPSICYHNHETTSAWLTLHPLPPLVFQLRNVIPSYRTPNPTRRPTIYKHNGRTPSSPHSSLCSKVQSVPHSSVPLLAIHYQSFGNMKAFSLLQAYARHRLSTPSHPLRFRNLQGPCKRRSLRWERSVVKKTQITTREQNQQSKNNILSNWTIYSEENVRPMI